ncbi:PilC/PilY family type IV pilus protein [Luteimonas sp. MJ293]|uniref:pilus assembly protein n=1 Tax=Luteimonas sp. MJ146 TaxID=3129240 RepID=UPI0031B9BB99
MKRSQPAKPRRAHRLLAPFVGFLAALVGASGHAASFPDFPLQTGTGSVPPNIIFIMDDSGSMGYPYMPGQTYSSGSSVGLPDSIQYRSYTNNPLYYDPRIDYQPWMTADGERHEGGTSYRSAFAHVDLAAGAINLSSPGSCHTSRLNGTNRSFCGGQQTFYVPKEGVVNPGTNSSNYHKYLITTGQAIRKCNGVGSECVNGITPTGRTPEAELNNYATWFSYHRTRMKAAKAGASEAFGQLGRNFRVGYDSIWGRQGDSKKNLDVPVLQIPVGVNSGLFSGTNRDLWFEYLFAARNSGNTPLLPALQRAGRYYEEKTANNGPWGPLVGGEQLSCRQSFSILTTDGHWNDTTGYVSVGNADGTASEIRTSDDELVYAYEPVRPYTDTVSNTLADVAMHYWKRDLRPDLDNNVPSSTRNPASWQHMVTFGISIGEKGTLSPDDVPLIESGEKNWPSPFSNTTTARIDDLLHATVNARGEFVAASNPQEFANALKSSLEAIAATQAAGANVASNGPSLSTDSMLFQATYTSGEWSGDMVAVSIAGGGISGTESWSMAGVASEDRTAFSERKVWTTGLNGTIGSFPRGGQVDALAREPDLPRGVSGENNAKYIRGSSANEGQGINQLRRRTSPFGTIVNSSPFYVAENETIFVGANDGMLHAVNATNGQVRFSYVPRGLDFSRLAELSSQDYQHAFFVDGGIDVTSRMSSGSADRNALVASLGRGGKGVFGLDVTSPDADSASQIVKWDLTFQDGGANNDKDTGYILGAPLVRRGNNGELLAIYGNGIDSANGNAVLYIRNALTGALYSQITVDSSGNNGLSEVRAADLDGNGTADVLYAGDLKGNVWKFDISGSSPGTQWKAAGNSGGVAQPLFVARDPSGDRQPITASVALAREPRLTGDGRVFVLFGTGSYITNSDLANTQVQTIYAVVDDQLPNRTSDLDRSDLQRREIKAAGVDSLGRAARSWESYSELADDKLGWYVDLGYPVAGERVVTAPTVRGRALWFSSIIPELGDGCDVGGTGYLNAVDVFTGTNPGRADGSTYSFIDINQDGEGDDYMTGSGPDGGDGLVTSVDVGIGMPSQPTFVGDDAYVGGSDAELERLQGLPVGKQPHRLRWHERVDRE